MMARVNTHAIAIIALLKVGRRHRDLVALQRWWDGGGKGSESFRSNNVYLWERHRLVDFMFFQWS